MSTKTDLELQFDTITPSNLKDNETISKLLSLYTSSFSDQSDILENPLNLLDTDFLIEKYEETSNTKFDDVRKELFKIHLQEIYQTFAEIGDSEEIYNKFKGVYKALDVPTDQLKIVADIDKSINSEYLDAASSFKTKKGTRSGFFFVYDIINRAGIQAINADEFFNLIEGTKEDATTPYEYTVETSLYKEVFNKTVVPLAHPVGFNWNFIRLLFLTMEDYFVLEQIKTLNDTTLTCYGNNNGIIQQEEIVNSKIYGKLKNFEVSVDQNKKEGIIIDYNPLDGSEGNGLRLIKEHNGRVILYDRQSEKIVKVDGEPTGEIQYLEITDVRVPLSQNGILTVNKIQRELLGETFEVVESIEFKEYTIIDKPYIDIEYKIRGDKEGNWNTSKIYYEDFSAKVVSDDVKFFNPYTITRSELLEKTGSYNGRIVEDKGNNCLLNYKATYSYKVSTKDVHEYIENIRPQQTKLEMDTSNIEIPQSEVNIAISEGRDPYEGLYSNVDHTIQEENWYDTGDNWARLDYGNYKLTGNIGDTNINPTFNKGHLASEIVIDEVTEEVSYIPDGKIIDLTIGGDWILSDNDTHEFDKGFNPNAPEGARWEQYYRPQSLSDLALVNSTNTVERYERDNTEWYDDKDKQWNTSQNNNQYHAWEDVNMDVFIQVFSDEEYCYDMFTDWNIGDEEYIGCLYVEGQAHSQRVDADVYRGQWSYIEESSDFRKYEQFDIIENKDLIDEYITDENSEIKSLSDNKHVYEHKDMQDLFYYGVQEETVIDGFDINGNIFDNNNETGDTRPAYIGYEYMYKDDFSFGMEFNLVPKPVPYCYDTFVNWNIDEDAELIGCAFVDGKGHYEEVQAEIYRAQWNYIEFLDNENTIRNSEFEKYEETNFALMPAVNEYWYTNENGDDTSITETNTTNDYSKLEDEDVQKDWHELEIGEEWDIGGDHNNPETNSIRQVYIGWENMFKDDSNIFDRSLMTSQQIYTYNTFTAVYINEEENDGLIISDNDYIDGKGLNLEPEADIYRSEWNIHDDHLVTEDNVISSEYEVYGMKVYRKDGENWIYLENNNIEVA